MEFGVPGVFHIDIELLQLSNPTFLGEAIKSGHVSPFSVTLVHQHVPVTVAVFSLMQNDSLSPFYYFVLPASECLGPGLNLTSFISPWFRIKAVSVRDWLQLFLQKCSPFWCVLTFPFGCPDSCHSAQKVASPRESYLELNPPLAVLIHTSQC